MSQKRGSWENTVSAIDAIKRQALFICIRLSQGLGQTIIQKHVMLMYSVQICPDRIWLSLELLGAKENKLKTKYIELPRFYFLLICLVLCLFDSSSSYWTSILLLSWVTRSEPPKCLIMTILDWRLSKCFSSCLTAGCRS